jgi:GntR family transcriptional repressor for pyruvate dehydrogenase complex
VLQAQGVVRSQQGTGSQLTLRGQPVARAERPRDLERTSAAAAAERHSPADLARLREALAAMKADLPREEFNPLDTAFHVAIAESGGNRLVSELTAAIRESLRGALLDGMRAEEDWPGLRAVLRREHRGILAAIEAGDGVQAAERMEAHIRAFHRRLP